MEESIFTLKFFFVIIHNMQRKSPNMLRAAFRPGFLSLSAFFLSALVISPCQAEEKCQIFFIKSRSLQPYDFVIAKAEESLKPFCASFESKVFDMEGDSEKARSILSEIRKNPPELIISVGSESTLFLAQNVSDVPIIFTMVYRTDSIYHILSERKNMKGVFVNIDMKTPFSIIRQIKTDLKKVGVIYNPLDFSGLVDGLYIEARRQGMELVRIEVKDEVDVPRAMREFVPQIDALYIISNPVFSKKEVMRRIVLETLKNKVFVIGESSDVVDKGGLIGFGFDINHLAQSTAELVLMFRESRDIASIGSRLCEKFNLFLNDRTSQNLGITIPDEIRAGARKIVQ
jgi:putative tryptophan/tyrosine transport system substrate-binding protein